MSDRRFWATAGIIWAVVSMLLVAVSWTAIAAWRFPDPDDQMRLLQVRDWLAGQSWFDVTQYRLNWPQGVPMHWSRLVDLPIAGVILLLTPFVGTGAAEHVALVTVPLVTLGVVLALLGTIARRMLGDEPALFAILLAPLCVEVTHQLRPMRIDHHGWQIALALAATLALLDTNRRRGGWIAGAAIAAWLAISLEGLPLAAAMLALVALCWVANPAEARLMRGTSASLALTSLALFAVTQPLAAWRAPVCDAVSPPYLAALAIVALGMTGATLLPLRHWAARLSVLALVGVVALAAIPLLTPACISGPFAQLDPLVREVWYLRVAEGLPMWRQTPIMILNSMAMPLIGLAGSVVGWRGAAPGVERSRWATLLFLTACATVAALLVQRSSAVAAVIAIPGAVRLIHPALVRARTIGNVALRTAVTLAILIAAAPGLALRPVIETLWPNPQVEAVRAAQVCLKANDMGALRGLPRGNVLAPLDISPTILLLTPHAAVASGHHRGSAAMRDVIAAFSGSEATAREIVARRRIDYVAYCPGLAETVEFNGIAPAGFFARIDRGEAPTWLTPVAIPNSSVKLWRVN